MKTLFSLASAFLILTACNENTQPTSGNISIEIDANLVTQIQRDKEDIDAVSLATDVPLKFKANQFLVKVGRAPNLRMTKIEKIIRRYDAQLIDDGKIPEAPPEIPKNQLRNLDIQYGEYALFQVLPNDVDVEKVSEKLKTVGLKGNLKLSSQNAVNLLWMLLNRDTDDETALNAISEPTAYQEHLQSGFYSALPPVNANYLDANTDVTLNAIKVPAAWNLSYYGRQLDGWGTKIAIIDTEFDPRSNDIASFDGIGQVLPIPLRYVSTYDTVRSTTDILPPTASLYHGLSTAAFAAGTRGNHYGIAGVAPRADLILLQAGGWSVSNDWPPLNDAYITKSIEIAVSWGAQVMNMSFGRRMVCAPEWQLFGFIPIGNKCEAPYLGALKRARDNNVIAVAAASNNGTLRPNGIPYGSEVSIPCAYDEVICVGSINADDRSLSGFSDRGPAVDIYAPGSRKLFFNGQYYPDSDARSTPTPITCNPWQYLGNYYCVGTPNNIVGAAAGTVRFRYGFAGTSMSAPLVAGTVALMKQINSNISTDSAKNLLRQFADRDSPTAQVNLDAGILNAKAVLYNMGAR